MFLSAATLFQGCRGAVNEDPLELPQSESRIYISEYMTADGWLEIFNPADTTVDLSGYTLVVGGRKRNPSKNHLAAGEYLLFSDIRDMDQADCFYLKDGNGALVDLITKPKHKKYKSLVRKRLADGSFMEHNEERISPGYPNTLDGWRTYQAGRRKENTTGVFISEIMVDNESVYRDPDGEFVDYIELYNSSAKAVDISGWGLSDRENANYLFRFPEKTTLEAGAYVVVNCSSAYKDVSDDRSFRAPFSVSNGEDGVYLSDRGGHIIGEVCPVSTLENQSLVSLDGKVFVGTFSISPGYPNNAAGAAQYAASCLPSELPKVYIAEALPGNKNNAGWVELVNRGDAAVSLEGFSLTDEKSEDHCFTFPDKSIPAGGRLMVYADASTKGLAAGFSFRKSAALFLRGKDGDSLDAVTLSDLPSGSSKGRNADSPAWRYYRNPSPGSANSGGSAEMAIAPIASVPSGQYDGIDTLKVEFFADGDIYYTTDGSAPTTSSKKYKGPFRLTKTSVLRTMAVRDGALNSPVSSWTYLVNEGHTLDVVSLMSAPDGLFSTGNGIYANGPRRLLPVGQESGDGIPYPYVAANFWRKWVRQSNLSYLPKHGNGFSYDCGASIFGGFSRINAKKSFKFKFKRQYGTSKLHYKVFENRDFSNYDCLVMRTGGQDVYGTLIKDDLASYLMDPLIDVMATKPTVFYINGEYYGIYFMREKVNRDFIASHYGIPTDNIDIIQGNCHCEAGSLKDWNSFLAYVRSHDVTKQENYEWVKEHMDVQSYCDWIIAEIYVGNRDAGNVRCFRSPNLDNKWHWLLYDVDMGLSTTRSDGFLIYLKPTQQKICSTELIRTLLKNKEFRALFLDRLEYQMTNIWSKESMNGAIDQFVEWIGGEVERNNKRWSGTYKTWEGKINGLRDFANGRQEYLKSMFGSDAFLKGLVHMTPEELDRCFVH